MAGRDKSTFSSQADLSSAQLPCPRVTTACFHRRKRRKLPVFNKQQAVGNPARSGRIASVPLTSSAASMPVEQVTTAGREKSGGFDRVGERLHRFK
jgi:hypothetical protein